MVLQSFEPPRKVHDLGAVVASFALLLDSGLAGLLTGRPPRLALQPLDDTAAAAVGDLSIESAQELALLSPDVAVVLAGDGALWALLDMRGTATLRPLGHSARALCARPQGESALAIREGGQAITLTLSGSQVDVRTIAVRGALRACDVGEQVTYAVVDGDSGAQLHVHAGPTLEASTSVRATLPEAAAGLDRVRGSQQLTALYRRHDDRICLVQGPAKRDAKLVRLEAKPADVAVIDGCLLVAFADGRLAFYDPEAIAGASDGPLEATHTISLGAQGRPRVLLASACKGDRALWIGTTAGEVLRAPLVLREGDAVARQRIADTMPTLVPTAQLSPTGPLLAEVLAARGREIEELRAENERIMALYAAELDAQQAEHARALEEQRAEHAKALDEQRATYARALEELCAAKEQLALLTTELDERVKDQERMRLEVDRLLTDLSRERERIQKTFPFGSDGLSSVERARNRLDAMIAQAQGLFFKRPRG